MNIGWPEGIYLVLLFIWLGMCITRDGQLKTGRHSFCYDLINELTILGLLWWG